jgi:hypothetical protein
MRFTCLYCIETRCLAVNTRVALVDSGDCPSYFSLLSVSWVTILASTRDIKTLLPYLVQPSTARLLSGTAERASEHGRQFGCTQIRGRGGRKRFFRSFILQLSLVHVREDTVVQVVGVGVSFPVRMQNTLTRAGRIR